MHLYRSVALQVSNRLPAFLQNLDVLEVGQTCLHHADADGEVVDFAVVGFQFEALEAVAGGDVAAEAAERVVSSGGCCIGWGRGEGW